VPSRQICRTADGRPRPLSRRGRLIFAARVVSNARGTGVSPRTSCRPWCRPGRPGRGAAVRRSSASGRKCRYQSLDCGTRCAFSRPPASVASRVPATAVPGRATHLARRVIIAATCSAGGVAVVPPGGCAPPLKPKWRRVIRWLCGTGSLLADDASGGCCGGRRTCPRGARSAGVS
jgi:hypothetical protein